MSTKATEKTRYQVAQQKQTDTLPENKPAGLSVVAKRKPGRIHQLRGPAAPVYHIPYLKRLIYEMAAWQETETQLDQEGDFKMPKKGYSLTGTRFRTTIQMRLSRPMEMEVLTLVREVAVLLDCGLLPSNDDGHRQVRTLTFGYRGF